MTRNEKLRKLGNAVREYRGAYIPDSKKWVTPPKRQALERVKRWLAELKLDVEANVRFIDECQRWDDFRAWISKI